METELTVVWAGDSWRQDRVLVPCPEPTPELDPDDFAGWDGRTRKTRETQEAILAALAAGHFTVVELALATDRSREQAVRALQFLVHSGEVVIVSRGVPGTRRNQATLYGSAKRSEVAA